MGKGVYTKSALQASAELVRTKQNLDNKHRAFLFSPSSAIPWATSHWRTPSGARVFTLSLHRVEETAARALRGIPNRYSARRVGASPTYEPAQWAWPAPEPPRTTGPRSQRSAEAGSRLTCRELIPPAATALPLPRSCESPFHS